MIDVKKFVVVFLILATVASSLALLAFGIGEGSSLAVSPNKNIATQSSAIALAQGNAFAPKDSASGAGGDLTDAGGAVASDPNNLTSQLASSMVNNLMAANPDGPLDNGDGSQTMTSPDAAAILADMSTSSALRNLQIPDWDFEAAMKTVKISASSSDDDVVQYGTALGKITNSYLVATDVRGIVGSPDTATPENISFVASQVESTLNNIAGLTAPKDLADLHKGLIKILVYEKNALALAQNASDDPAKAALIFQAESNKYTVAVQEFQDALNAAAKNKAFSLAFPRTPQAEPGGAIAFFNNLIGVRTAHAQFAAVVSDPITETETTLTVAQMIWQFVQNIVLQLLKNALITTIQNQVLKLITNSGNPRFIQNWAGLLVNAFNTAAGSALGQIIPGLCDHFSTDATAWLKNIYTSSNIKPGGVTLNGAGATNCSLNKLTNKTPSYDNFNAGGFGAFGALLLPSNNIFGNFAQAHDQIGSLTGASQNAAQNKSVAGSGFPGQPLCVDGSKPNPGDGNKCDDGKDPIIVTPGKSDSDTLSRSLNSHIDLTVNATNIVGILTTITTALLSQLINSGVNGLMGTAAAGTGATPPPPPPPVPLKCVTSVAVASSSQQIAFNATGGKTSDYTWAAPNGTPTFGAGFTFTTSYLILGPKTITVTNVDPVGGNTIATCTVTIQ